MSPFEYLSQSISGNQLFEMLSLIGIADTLDRFPYIRGNHQNMLVKMGDKIRELFPLLEQQFRIVYWNVSMYFWHNYLV